MKNSFTLFEIILTLIISSIVIIYSSFFIKELYTQNQNSLNTQTNKLDLLSTKIFLQKHKNEMEKLKYENQNLYFDSFLLLENVKEFSINNVNNTTKIYININNSIKQEWKF